MLLYNGRFFENFIKLRFLRLQDNVGFLWWALNVTTSVLLKDRWKLDRRQNAKERRRSEDATLLVLKMEAAP
jgi:hypothetical protein